MTSRPNSSSLSSQLLVLLLLQCFFVSNAFVPSVKPRAGVPLTMEQSAGQRIKPARSALMMGMDMVTYLRTEWISAALCTNQTPRSADTCLQLGTDDGRAVTFIPRTIRELITSSAELDGKLKVSTRRQLKQQQERRSGSAKVTYVDQRCDDLKETADESVDVVISLQAAQRMLENGLDWKKSIQEAARVLKPGGRFLFVEQTEIEGESYLDYLGNLRPPVEKELADDEEDERAPVFEVVGWDDVDLVLVPHIAGVMLKSEDAGLTAEDLERKLARAQKEQIADLSIAAYERGRKKRKKKKAAKSGEVDSTASS